MSNTNLRSLIAPGRAVIIALVVMSVMFFDLISQSAGKTRQTASEAADQPGVLQTSPQALRNDVESSLSEITVTFNQPMMDKSWSWTGGGKTYPKTTSEPSYDPNRTTCSLPVKLEPGKVYWVGINSPSYQNFKSEAGIPAKRYVIVFATKDPNGNPTPIPDNLSAQAEAINENTERAKPPVIVKTSPQAYSDDIEPSLSVITVTFNRPMTDKSWSWTGGGETFPEITGKPSYDSNKTTCSLPVKLEPGKVYWVGINSPSYQNFKSKAGIPVKRYVIMFTTKDPNGNPTPLPGVLFAKAKAINDS
ncbi:MAG: Ig-like domain-containing protein [Sedimentisphaerales bacterium]|nr:Ig-like domain-containing protein [Sedimentisphaerales bacterium]